MTKQKEIIPKDNDQNKDDFTRKRVLTCLNCQKTFNEVTMVQASWQKPDWNDEHRPKSVLTGKTIYLCDKCNYLVSDFWGQFRDHIDEIKHIIKGFKQEMNSNYLESDGFNNNIKKQLTELIKSL